MATISSHILDSLLGDHAQHIRVACHHVQTDGQRMLLFDTRASAEGRIKQIVDLPAEQEVELSVFSRDYFEARRDIQESGQIVSTVIVRLTLKSADDVHHIPIMLAPHSYSVWWSGEV